MRAPAVVALAALVTSSFTSSAARAFCRTTTCDPEEDLTQCDRVQGCATRGEPLFWPDACVTFAVQSRGSPSRGITAFEVDRAMRDAFAAWLGTECPNGGGRPSIGVIPLGGAECDQVEFNPPRGGRAGPPNANIVMFRDDEWPYPDEYSVIARTSLTYDPNTGVILDADIEINSFQNEFSTGEDAISNDLQAVLTHEVGHFLGLDHSEDEHATMRWNYDLANLGARTLSVDDRAGICSVYAPDEIAEPGCPGDTGPRHGFSRECGSELESNASCLSLTERPGSPAGAWLSSATLLLAWARRRRSCSG